MSARPKLPNRMIALPSAESTPCTRTSCTDSSRGDIGAVASRAAVYDDVLSSPVYICLAQM